MADKIPVKAIYTGSDVTSLGELTSSDTINGSYITDNTIDEANLKVSNTPTNGYVLTAQSGASGGLTWATDSTTDSTKLPLAGGAMTGAITTNSTFDGVDIAVRDAILTSTTTTAGAALPKAGGTMTGTTVLKGITETEATNSTTTYTVDLANGTVFDLTSASAVTITMPSAAAGKSFTIIVKTAPAWSGTILWASATVPSATTISIYSFISDGTSWYGMEAGNGFA